jgi:hypothetical protein
MKTLQRIAARIHLAAENTMKKIFRFLAAATVQQQIVFLGISVLLTPPAPAQDHVLPLSDMNAALSRAYSARESHQAAVDRFLSHERVQNVLKHAGIEANQIRQAASILSDEDQARLASKIRGVEADLAAGELKDSQVTLIIMAVTGFAVLTILILAFK